MGDGSVAAVIGTNNDSVYVPDGTYVRHYRLPIAVWSTNQKHVAQYEGASPGTLEHTAIHEYTLRRRSAVIFAR